VEGLQHILRRFRDLLELSCHTFGDRVVRIVVVVLLVVVQVPVLQLGRNFLLESAHTNDVNRKGHWGGCGVAELTSRRLIFRA
jgi:hypothetical protein